VNRKWLICSLLVLSVIPVLSSALPGFAAGYGGGGGSKTMTTTSSTTQVSATSVPEHIDLTVPLLTTVGLMLLFVRRKDAEPD
jgi:hypothetical protein